MPFSYNDFTSYEREREFLMDSINKTRSKELRAGKLYITRRATQTFFTITNLYPFLSREKKKPFLFMYTTQQHNQKRHNVVIPTYCSFSCFLPKYILFTISPTIYSFTTFKARAKRQLKKPLRISSTCLLPPR